jgi:hypothetical protein
MKMSDIVFLSAIDAAVAGEPERLAQYVREHHELTVAQSQKLADFIDGKLKRKKGRPSKIQRPNMLMQCAAWDVEELKAEWRKTGRRYRIHRPALEAVAARWEITPDKLENFIRRSKPPRKNQ